MINCDLKVDVVSRFDDTVMMIGKQKRRTDSPEHSVVDGCHFRKLNRPDGRASINNRVFRTVGSPLLLPDHHNCVIKPRNDVDFQVTIDHLTLLHKDVKSILCSV